MLSATATPKEICECVARSFQKCSRRFSNTVLYHSMCIIKLAPMLYERHVPTTSDPDASESSQNTDSSAMPLAWETSQILITSTEPSSSHRWRPMVMQSCSYAHWQHECHKVKVNVYVDTSACSREVYRTLKEYILDLIMNSLGMSTKWRRIGHQRFQEVRRLQCTVLTCNCTTRVCSEAKSRVYTRL